MNPIPFTVIGGFLGAGKTTLLNRLLRGSTGRRFAVLVNDFGALDIDGSLVADHGGDTIALANGCLCCTIGDSLVETLLACSNSRNASTISWSRHPAWPTPAASPTSPCSRPGWCATA